MEELVKEMGFDSLQEYHSLVANIDLSTVEKLNAFNEWKNEDGTKVGNFKIPTLIIS